ncbi:glutathione S-transferase family protein [Sphingomonas sp. AOB5]|uniref:glutathione S-transferase family protein n=1 Tax=Sphingomonas sp. AOB5 TaxID=3034017 RepID=UPI0023F98435|nr:glutathione S-transferase family protein [Sphingomonas sp. AOB5]MDF7774650.1 glutathione S-transferase family protein [Sphingomonas sp. AOB5]
MLIIGNHVSPYARKVLVALDIKGVDHEIDPIVPFYGTDAFTRISPLRRIPVLIDGDLVLNDSTVICEYLDEMYPDPPLMPRSPADRARARWMEEYADSRLGDLMIWRLFYARIVGPRVFKTVPDEAAIAKVTDVDLPDALDWIEERAPAQDFLFGHLCIADITYAAFFRNALLAGWTIDAARWPKTAAWIARVEAVPAFARSIRYEQAIVGARSHERPEALRAAGARVSEASVGGTVPASSIMLG